MIKTERRPVSVDIDRGSWCKKFIITLVRLQIQEVTLTSHARRLSRPQIQFGRGTFPTHKRKTKQFFWLRSDECQGTCCTIRRLHVFLALLTEDCWNDARTEWPDPESNQIAFELHECIFVGWWFICLSLANSSILTCSGCALGLVHVRKC